MAIVLVTMARTIISAAMILSLVVDIPGASLQIHYTKKTLVPANT